MTNKFIKVKWHKRPFGKQCNHCGSSAVVEALRVHVESKHRLPVAYCIHHAEVRGVLGSKEES